MVGSLPETGTKFLICVLGTEFFILGQAGEVGKRSKVMEFDTSSMFNAQSEG